MRRILPAPVLFVSLFVLWLVLNPPASAGSVIVGALVALAIPLLVAPLRPQQVRLRRPWALVRLVLRVGADVLRSNLDVARGVLCPTARVPQGSFVRIPLELRDPSGLAALAIITTVVPGTVWTKLAMDRSAVLLHVFDVADEAAFVADYKARYERPLQEIFE